MLKNKLLAAMGGAPANYIEDVFSTYLYTGNGSTQTITNGIDLAGEGGLVWLKNRSVTSSHRLVDTVRGALSTLFSESTSAAVSRTAPNTDVNSFTSTGFVAGNFGSTSGANWASWTFRKQPKFFDVVTYTGNGSSTQTISHNLGSTPGAVIIKSTAEAKNWAVWHRTQPFEIGKLNLTDAWTTFNYFITSNGISSTTFQVGGGNNSDANNLTNVNGQTYVAYLFAHNAGGFGLSGEDNVISCGSYTGNGLLAGPVVTLGYEPQWVLVKRTDSTGNWQLQDNMRSLSQTNTDMLFPNLSNAATTGAYPSVVPTATGFYIGDNGTGYNASGGTYIYIAIRRGPMKVPTTGTSVFNPAYGTGVSGSFDTSFPVDLGFYSGASISTGAYWTNRLTGNQYLTSFNTNAEGTFGSTQPWDRMEDWYATADNRFIGWGFRRAPGFMDEVCYTGNGTTQNLSHNLAAVPELMIVKARSIANRDWAVYFGNNVKAMSLNSSARDRGFAGWNDTTPTSSVFSIGADSDVNSSGATYVAYLFATCPGVQSIQSYVGDGTTGRTINCGFTGGARFVCIKATSTTGSWWTFDSARGITTNADPVLQLNSTAAEITSADAIDPAASGFIVNQEATCSLNASGVSYLVWAIA